MDNNDKPRKPRKKKQDTPPTPTPAANQQIYIAPLTQEESEDFISHINKYLQKKSPSKPKSKTEDFKVLQNSIDEYLESYIAFGYTFDGQRVLIQHCSTPRDRDAIIEFLKAVFIMNASREENLNLDDTDE